MNKILIKLHDGLGDIMLAMPSIKVVRQAFPNAQITAYPHSRTREGDIRHNFLRFFKYFDNYIFNDGEHYEGMPEGTKIKNFYADYKINGDNEYDLYLTNVMSPDTSHFILKLGAIGIHLIDAHALCLIGRTLDATEKKINIDFEERNYIKKITGYDNYITIQAWHPDKNRIILEEEYIKLIPFLKAAFPDHAICFLMNKKFNDINDAQCFNFNEFDAEHIFDLLDVLKKTKLHISPESGIAIICGMFNRDVIYYTNTTPYLTAPLFSNFNFIYTENIRSITAELLSKKISEFLNGVRYKFYENK